MSKQELVTSSNKFSLDTAQVKFDAKITSKDLIEASIFGHEEKLLNDEKELNKYIKTLEETDTELRNKKVKLIETFVKKYKNKDAEVICKKFNEFLGKKEKVEYNGHETSNNKIRITISIGEEGYHSSHIEKRFDIDISDDVIKTNTEIKNNTKELEKSTLILQTLQQQIKEVPRMKKRVNAAFVKTLMKNENMTGAQILEKLHEEIEKGQC